MDKKTEQELYIKHKKIYGSIIYSASNYTKFRFLFVNIRKKPLAVFTKEFSYKKQIL